MRYKEEILDKIVELEELPVLRQHVFNHVFIEVLRWSIGEPTTVFNGELPTWAWFLHKDADIIDMKDDYNWKEVFGVGDHMEQSIESVDDCPTDQFEMDDIKFVVASREGENDGEDWVAVCQLYDGRWLAAYGGCCYTGWDCQAGIDLMVSYTFDDACRFGLTSEHRQLLEMGRHYDEDFDSSEDTSTSSDESSSSSSMSESLSSIVWVHTAIPAGEMWYHYPEPDRVHVRMFSYGSDLDATMRVTVATSDLFEEDDSVVFDARSPGPGMFEFWLDAGQTYYIRRIVNDHMFQMVWSSDGEILTRYKNIDSAHP